MMVDGERETAPTHPNSGFHPVPARLDLWKHSGYSLALTPALPISSSKD
jgi:hypothetical protein